MMVAALNYAISGIGWERGRRWRNQRSRNLHALSNLSPEERADALIARYIEPHPEAAEERYREGNRRLRAGVARLVAESPPPDTAFYMGEGRQFTPAEAVREILEAEERVQTAGVLAPATSAGGV